MKTHLFLAAIAAVFSVGLSTHAADYYVSASTGKGKTASKEEPAKDLGNILSKLLPGDTVHIAGGTYTGRGDNGSDVITVPVSLIGGYSDDFSTRDPWGEHRTIFGGDNLSENFDSGPRVMIDLMRYREKEMPPILVDGLIFDESSRNRYVSKNKLEIVRMANPKTGENPTPSQGALVIRASKTGNFDPAAHWDITVTNCAILNSAPTQGALSVAGHKGSQVKILNNLLINNTGTAILAGTKYVGEEEPPSFEIANNTVLFTWKYEPGAQSYSGNSFKADGNTTVDLHNNVFAFADRVGIHNAAKANLHLKENLILGNFDTDYLEFDTRIDLADIEDEAECLHGDSTDNISEEISIPVSGDWLKLYGSRELIDRTAREADIEEQETIVNEFRRILGLPLQAEATTEPKTPVWLPSIPLEDALAAGEKPYNGKYGCDRPQ